MEKTDPAIIVLDDEVHGEAINSVPTPQQVYDDEVFARQLALECNHEELAKRRLQEDEEFARELQQGLQPRPQDAPPDDEAFARLLQEESLRLQQHVLDDETFANSLQDSRDLLPQALDVDETSHEETTTNTNSTKHDLEKHVEYPGEEGLLPEARDEVNTLWAQHLRGEEIKLEPAAASARYSLHAVHRLLQNFPRAPSDVVKKVFSECGSYSDAQECLESSGDRDKLSKKRPRAKPPPCPMPKALAREMKSSTKGVSCVAGAIRQRNKSYETRVEQLRALGGLSTCGCCFDDEVLPENELRCTASEGHGFCIPCVKRQAMEFFSSKLFTLNLRESESSSSSSGSAPQPSSSGPAVSSTVLRCMHMSSSCSGQFSENALRRALPPKEYVRYSRRSAALHAAASGLQDLVACPGCDFMVQMTDPTDCVVRCFDPECGKVTCRWCKEPDHRPLRCEEVEKDGEVRIRTFLEEHVAEGVMKRCPNPKCRKPCEKTEGCNHITCPCGTHSCYLCGEKINASKPYDHYKDGSQGGGANNSISRCTVYGVPAWAKKAEETARAEADKALEAYLKENPELQDIMHKRQDVLKRTLSHVTETGAKHKKKHKAS